MLSRKKAPGNVNISFQTIIYKNMYFTECQCFKHGQQHNIELSVKALEIDCWGTI